MGAIGVLCLYTAIQQPHISELAKPRSERCSSRLLPPTPPCRRAPPLSWCSVPVGAGNWGVPCVVAWGDNGSDLRLCLTTAMATAT